MIVLNNDQLNALEFLEYPTQFKILQGSAGTGKTTVIAEYCNRNKFKKILISAPTHKAVQVLRSKTNNECKTIHSYFKLKKKLVEDKYKFVYEGDDLDFFDVIVIDEGSMIDRYLLTIIEENIHPKTQVIFVGDIKQLNPVGEPDSPIFKKGYKTFTLTEIIRHQNDIIDLSQNYVQWLKEKRSGECFSWVPNGEVDIEGLVKANGSDSFKFITWRNEVVATVNNIVRSYIYDNPQQLEIGEVILMTEAYKDVYDNNEEVEVLKFEENENYYNHQDILYPLLKTINVNDKLMVVAEEDKHKHLKNLDDLRKRALVKSVSWHDFYKYYETFGYYQYNHAITVHKSQGSTYDKSLINISDIMINRNIPERNRMLYTAITRSKTYNYFI